MKKTEDEEVAVAIMIEAGKDCEYIEDAMLAGYRALRKHLKVSKDLSELKLSEPISDGWIPWRGEHSEGPSIGVYTLVYVRLRDGHESVKARSKDMWRWNNWGGSADIIAYRLAEVEVEAEIPF